MADTVALPDLTETEGITKVFPCDAEALHLDQSGWLLSAQVTGICRGCRQDITFQAWQVEGYVAGDELRIETTWDRKHGCGTWPDDVTIAVAKTGDDEADETAIDEAVKAMRTEVGQRRIALADEIRARLTDEVAERVAEITAEAESNGLDLFEAFEDELPRIDTMSSPGIGWDPESHTVTGWDFDPASDNMIEAHYEVAGADVTRETDPLVAALVKRADQINGVDGKKLTRYQLGIVAGLQFAIDLLEGKSDDE